METTSTTLDDASAESKHWDLSKQLSNLRTSSFRLHEFLRTTWVSQAAKDVWAPRIRKISSAWAKLERLSVVHGIRACTMTSRHPRSLPAFCHEVTALGLHAVPLAVEGISPAGYSATATEAQDDEYFQFRVVVGATDAVNRFVQAWGERDDETIGSLLGYPKCCRDFFRTVWVGAKLIDTTWAMALNTERSRETSQDTEVSGSPLANILWRWLGVRAVPHLPCSFDCQATVEFATALLTLGEESGFKREMAWMRDILAWPVEWSAAHGIGQVRTPVLKFVMTTDATAIRYSVRRSSDVYPVESARGIVFPYKGEGKLRLSNSPPFKAGLDRPIPVQANGEDVAHSPWYWADNGFPSRPTMDAAHAPLVRAASDVCRKVLKGSETPTILDLGCGNGALLRKLKETYPGARLGGCEQDPLRHANIAKVLPEDYSPERLAVGDMFGPDLSIWDVEDPWDLAFLMPGRLLEVDERAREALLEHLDKGVKHVIAYAYGDAAQANGGFDALLSNAGLRVKRRLSESVALVDLGAAP